MIDSKARKLLAPSIESLAKHLDLPEITPNRITSLGLLVGIASAISAGFGQWWIALVLWLTSRVMDGIDGALARRRASIVENSAGGFWDITADFISYGSFVIGAGIGSHSSLLPFLFVLFGYYINGSSFLAFSSIAEKSGKQFSDGRSLSFLPGLAEASETIFVHSIWCLLPKHAEVIAWVWAGIVFVSATLRIYSAFSILNKSSVRLASEGEREISLKVGMKIHS